jgi:hypothetical protein
MGEMKLCEKCGSLSVYDPYFQKFICTNGRCLHGECATTKDTYGKWIQCSDRLPQTNESYLVTTQDGYVTTAEWDNAQSSDSWNSEPTWVFEELWEPESSGYVIAWMPMPEPYKICGDA